MTQASGQIALVLHFLNNRIILVFGTSDRETTDSQPRHNRDDKGGKITPFVIRNLNNRTFSTLPG